VYGLSTADGSRRWSFSRNEPRLTLRGTSKPLIANGDAIIGLDNGKVAALALDTGEVDWQTVIAVPSGASELEQLVDVDGRLAKEGDDLFAASYGKQLAALDLESGRVLWRHKIASYSGVTSGKDALYVSAIDSTVISLDRITGSVYWKNGALSYRGISRPVIQGDYVLVNDREGYLHWFTQDGGKLAGRIQLEDVGFASAPVVEGHLVYVEADNGRLSAVKMSPIRQKASGGTNEKGASKKGSAGSAAITPLQDHDHDSSGDFFEPPLKQSPPSR
jgi:outer membrane protein assembly factor BamB